MTAAQVVLLGAGAALTLVVIVGFTRLADAAAQALICAMPSIVALWAVLAVLTAMTRKIFK